MLSSLLLCLLSVGQPAGAADAVVVCPAEFRVALKPWVEHRASQGHVVELLEPAEPEALRKRIRTVAKRGKLTHILLVGDAVGNGPLVPTFHPLAEVNVNYGSEQEIASDNAYADFDDDGLPDAAIGRISVDKPEELATIVRRIIRYETEQDFGQWRRRVNLVAGVGGFGSLIDGTIEMTAKQFLSSGIPPAYGTSMTYGSWQSPYCPDPRRFQEAAVARFNEGCLFWVYLGHGHPQRLDRVHVPGAAYSILEARDLAKLRCPQGPPIAIMLSCYTGAFDFQQDCLAEEMMRLPEGPIAVLSGSRVTMPYAMGVMSHEMLTEYFQHKPKTLGEIVKNAKRRMVLDAALDAAPPEATKIDNRKLLDLLGSLMSPRPDLLAAERREHVELFNLLGDPLLRIAYPQEVKLETVEESEAGKTLKLRMTSPLSGRHTVQLVCRRDRFTFQPPARSEFNGGSEALAGYHATYQRANDPRWKEHVVEMEQGTYEAEIPIPREVYGACHVRVFVEGRTGHALGSANVYVHRAKTTTAATAKNGVGMEERR